MLVADAVVSMLHHLDREFAVWGLHRDQLAASKFFRSATFIGINMSRGGANYGMVRPGQRLQTQNIGAGAVENDEDLGVCAKMLAKLP